MKLRHEFVDYIPKQLEDGVLYVSLNVGTKGDCEGPYRPHWVRAFPYNSGRRPPRLLQFDCAKGPNSSTCVLPECRLSPNLLSRYPSSCWDRAESPS